MRAQVVDVVQVNPWKNIDIGGGHIISFVQYKGEICGLNDLHKRPDGTDCTGGWVAFAGRSWDRAFDGKITTWDVLQQDPLTLSPSLLCRVCGGHGWIRNGRWEPA